MDENKNNKEGIDLSGALKDSGVKFEDSGWKAMKYYREPTTPKIIQWTMRYSGGLIKDEKRASYVLIGFVVMVIIISLFLFLGEGSKPTVVPSPVGDNPLPLR